MPKHQTERLGNGAVIIFNPGVLREEAERTLRDLEARGIIDGSQWVGGKTPVHGFNPEHGGPVWYIP